MNMDRLWLRKGLISLAGVALAWLIVTRSFPAYLAPISPETALRLNAHQPDALLRLAELKLEATPPTDKNSDADIRALIMQARSLDPLNPQVPYLLAALAERTGDRTQAISQLTATLQQSLHESAAAYKLMLYSIETQNYVKATGYAELLLRTRPDSFHVVLPALIKLANTEAATEALIAMLGRNPYGRTWFFMELPPKVRDLRIPQVLLLGLRNTPHPPTNMEISQYLNQLVFQHNLHGMAYYTWLQFTPTEHFDSDNLVFNGQFQRPLTGPLFDWVIKAGAGVTAQIVTKPDEHGNHGLNLEFGSGRIEFGGVTQIMLLAPGTYQFSTQVKGNLIGRRGLVWRMTCDQPAPAILETPVQLGIQPAWQDITLTFTVPDTGCRGQQLTLLHTARSASEQLLSGSVWYRRVQVTRKPDR
jgi:hypothetical protein